MSAPAAGIPRRRAARFYDSTVGKKIVMAVSGVVLFGYVVAVQLALRKWEARPIPYVKKRAVGSSYASRTMYWSGPIIFVFVVYHIMQFTLGVGGTEYVELHPYENVVHGFRNPLVAGFYIFAMILLCTHLYHGLWSMFQTLGVSHPRYSPILRRGAAVVATLICLGEISIPIAVLTGIVGGSVL
ncbi:MAG: succinate dehydrogenase cytochrome b subunit [Bryobacteraceae bacterium]